MVDKPIPEMILRVAKAISPNWNTMSRNDRNNALITARVAIETIHRNSDVFTEACRRVADPKTGYICWEGISVNQAADVVDAIIGMMLKE
jgi:hypothetical protein